MVLEQHLSHDAVVACGIGVLERLLDEPFGAIPRGRPAVEPEHSGRIRAQELHPEQLAEEVVVAVPPAAPVERHEEEVRPRELGQQLGRAGRLSVASQSGPESRPSTEVARTKSRVTGSSASTTSLER